MDDGAKVELGCLVLKLNMCCWHHLDEAAHASLTS